MWVLDTEYDQLNIGGEVKTITIEIMIDWRLRTYWVVS